MMWAIWNLYLRDWVRDKHGRVKAYDNTIAAFGALAKLDDMYCEVHEY